MNTHTRLNRLLLSRWYWPLVAALLAILLPIRVLGAIATAITAVRLVPIEALGTVYAVIEIVRLLP